MKEPELRKHTTCCVCDRKTLSTGVPLFWRVTIERFGVDLRAVQRQDGLAAHLGSAPLAQIMGPNEDLAKPVMDPKVVTVCEDCALTAPLLQMV